jgi:tetratricopeptide (TPR) repeat protein
MQIKNWIKNASKLIGQALLFPMKLLFLPMRWIYLFAGLFHEKGADHANRNWFARLRRFATVPIKATYSFALRTIRNGKAIELLYLIPGLTILSFFVFVGYQMSFNKRVVEQRYLNGARRSISNQRPELAKKYFQRVIEKEDLSDNLIYNWGIILQQAGDVGQGTDMLASIAPENSSGYAPAHRALSLHLASKIQQSEPEATLLRGLRWHLEHSGEPTAATERAWAAYFIAKGKPQQAIERLENAANVTPHLHLAVAELCQTQGLLKKRNESLQRARRIFAEKLLQNPLDQDSRVYLSNVLLKLNEPKAAEDNLLSGLRIYRNPQLESEICKFYVLRFDQAIYGVTEMHDSAKLSTIQKFDMLRRSLSICPEHSSTYSRLASLTTVQNAESELKADFIAMVTGEHSSALAHACLGHLESQAGNTNEAEWHLDQAWGFNKNFGMIASKLAQAFISRESPDIEWALVLARQSVAQSPKEPDFRLVLAEIYLLKRDFNDAAAVLLTILEDGHQSASIHELLAAAYRGLGDAEKTLHHTTEASAVQTVIDN